MKKTTTERYVDYIDKNILPVINYNKLQASYSSDMVYAKTILNLLHKAMVKIYGGESFELNSGDEEFVVIPGVVRGIKSGNMVIVLLELDLSSSGEHCGTTFLCKYGAIPQDGNKNDPEVQDIHSMFMPYEYCYTATIPDDIHVNYENLSKEIKNVLNDFRK